MIAASERRIKNLQAEAEKTKEVSAIRGRIAAAEEAGNKQLVERFGEKKFCSAEIVRKKARLLLYSKRPRRAANHLLEKSLLFQTPFVLSSWLIRKLRNDASPKSFAMSS